MSATITGHNLSVNIREFARNSSGIYINHQRCDPKGGGVEKSSLAEDCSFLDMYNITSSIRFVKLVLNSLTENNGCAGAAIRSSMLRITNAVARHTSRCAQ
jgi:hypothetical protein